MSRARRLAGRVLRGRRTPPADPAVARLVASPLFDEEWYAVQAGDFPSREAAVRDYLERGRHAGLTPHPLFDPREFARHRADLIRPGEDSLAVYLRGRFFKAPVHPFLPMREYLAAHPGCFRHEHGPIGHYLEHVAPSGVRVNDWYEPTPDQPRGVVDWSFATARGLLAGQAASGAVVPSPGAGVSVVITAHEDWFGLPAVLRSLERADPELEVVVADAGLPLPAAVVAQALPDRFGRTRVLRGDTADAIAATTGEVVVLAHRTAEVRRGWADLIAALEDPDVTAAQPLLLRPSGSIHTAGTKDGRRLLAGWPVEDAAEIRETAELAPECVALRRADLDAAGGPGAELGRRLLAARPGRLAVVPESWVVVHTDSEDDALTTPPERASVRESPPRLRWAIKNPAPYWEADLWGDTHFAHQLAQSLRRVGQEVVIDHKEEFARAAGPRDDVVLVLRGLFPHHPDPGVLNLMWLISHPELVTAEELGGYDHVYVASTTFARELTEEWGVPATPLMQATDPSVFHPGLAEPDTGESVLFVGNSRRVMRTMVSWAMEQQLPLSVYGDYWEGLIPPELVRATHLPNAEVGAAYRAAGVVLNDHWDPMREGGFVSNRVFDALAAGARLVSDPVAGLAEVFGDAVPVVSSAQELADVVGAVLRGEPEAYFPDEQGRLRLAEQVAREHSFDTRARTLVDDAVTLWTQRQEGERRAHR